MSPFNLVTFLFLVVFPFYNQAASVEFTNVEKGPFAPGTLIPISATISGISEKADCHLELPEGWEALQNSQADGAIYLNAVRIPENALPGSYFIKIHLNNNQHSGTLIVPVGQLNRLQFHMSDAPSLLTNEESFTVDLIYQNEGNQTLSLQQLLSGEGLILEESCQNLVLEPGGQKVQKVALTVQTENEKAYLFVNVKDSSTGEIAAHRTAIFDVIPLGSAPTDPYIRIPSSLRIGAEKIGDHQTVYAAFEGEGIIDEEKQISTDFFVQLPFYRNEFALEEGASFSWNFESPEWEILAGDNGYAIGPLAEEDWFARGGMLTLRREDWEGGFFYAQDIFQDDYFHKAGGLFANYFLNDQIKLGGSYLCKQFKKKGALIGELDFEYEIAPQLIFEANIAKNFKSKRKQPLGYRFYLKGNGWNNNTFALERVYMGKHLRGTYDGRLDQLSGYLDQPISQHYSANIDFSFLHYCFDHACCNYFRDDPLRENSIEGQLNYYSDFGWNCSLTSLYFRAHDLRDCHRFNFRQYWGGFTFGTNKTNGYLNLSGSFGIENDLKRERNKFLQRYAVSFNQDILQSLKWNLFIEFGNINLFKAHAWRYAVGSQLSWQMSPQTFLSLFAQTHRYTRYGHWTGQYAFNFYHTFKNDHRLDIHIQKLDYTRRWCHSNEVQFLLSYSIPMDVIVGKKNQGTLEGEVYQYSTSKPLSRALVKCNERSILTDGQGRFSFQGLTPGSYSLNAEKLPANQASPYVEPHTIHIKGGKTTQVRIPAYEKSVVEGNIIILDYPDIGQLEDWKEAAQLKYRGPLESCLLQLENLKDGKVRQAATDSSGFFYFSDLYPGEWQLYIKPGALPGGYQLRRFPDPLHVKENQAYQISLEVVPENEKLFHMAD